MTAYKTNPRLWFALSVVAFFVIGFLVQFDMKGDKVSLVQITASALLHGNVGGLVFAAGLALVAAAIGWAVQCVVVVITGWKRGGP